MRRIPKDDYKKLLPLKKIAEASSYSFGYVSILVQRKKLKARKIGNKYYSTKEWFDQYLEYHGREGKKLPQEAVEELNTIFPTPISAGAEEPPSNPLLEGGQNFRWAARATSQAIAQANLKNQIDGLVERAIKEKLEAPARRPDHFVRQENLLPDFSFEQPARTEEKNARTGRDLSLPTASLEMARDKTKPARVAKKSSQDGAKKNSVS